MVLLPGAKPRPCPQGHEHPQGASAFAWLLLQVMPQRKLWHFLYLGSDRRSIALDGHFAALLIGMVLSRNGAMTKYTATAGQLLHGQLLSAWATVIHLPSLLPSRLSILPQESA